MKEQIEGTIGVSLKKYNLIDDIIKQANGAYLAYSTLKLNLLNIAISNGALACELYLKALLYSKINKKINTHSLIELVNLLYDYNKKAFIFIQNSFINNAINDFPKCIEQISNWFIEFRYPYEYEKYIAVRINILEIFLITLKRYCNEHYIERIDIYEQ